MRLVRAERRKAESLTHTGVGQGTEARRPTKRGIDFSRLKALRMGRRGVMRKGSALELFCALLRRALPYASMRKAFSLLGAAQQHRYSSAGGVSLNGGRTFLSASQCHTCGLESPHSVGARLSALIFRDAQYVGLRDL